MNTATTTVKILLVDDKKENLFSLEQLLDYNDNSIHFLQSTSGQEALKIAFFEEIALILLDVQMPDMDGYEVAKLLKANSRTRHIPIIFVTALNQEMQYVLEGYEKGAVDYLFKPLNPSLTRAKVRSFIQMYLQQKQMEKLTQLVNHSLDLMCVLEGKTLKITTLNPAWETVLGEKGSSLINVPFTNILSSTDQALADDLVSLLKDTRQQIEFESALHTETGEVKHMYWSFVYNNGFWYVNGKDITKRKLVEAKLETVNEQLEKKVKERTAALETVNQKLTRINADLDNFVYTASHDLKSPINNIEGLMNHLKKYLPAENEKVTGLISLIEQSIDRFKNTLKDLAQIAMLDNQTSDVEQIEFKPLIEEIKQNIKEQIDGTGAKVREEIEVGSIEFSKKNLRSILYNLISNAIKYQSPQRKPEILVKTYQTEDGFTVLSVSDNGLGIKKEAIPVMFDMFKRLHAHVEGSGIGLYLVRKIVENSEGKIEVESELDKGTTIRIFFKNHPIPVES